MCFLIANSLSFRSKDHSRDDDRRQSSRDRDRVKEDRGNSRDKARDYDRRGRGYDQGHGYVKEGDRSRSYDDSRNRRRSRSPVRDNSREYDRHRYQLGTCVFWLYTTLWLCFLTFSSASWKLLDKTCYLVVIFSLVKTCYSDFTKFSSTTWPKLEDTFLWHNSNLHLLALVPCKLDELISANKPFRKGTI